MIEGLRVLALLTARGGSKGVPRKNVRMVAGKPLIAWSIEVARQSRYADRVVLSSDDPEIIAVAKEWGCEVPFVRPAELARDDTPGIDVVLHALDVLPEYDVVVLLQPTSPLRIASDIDGCLEQMVATLADAVVSVCEPDKSPYWMFHVAGDGRLRPVIERPLARLATERRQDLPPIHVLNGAVYVARVPWVRQHRSFLDDGTVGYIMPKSRSTDIDTEADLMLADILLRDRQV